RKVAQTRGYFAIAKVQQVIRDPTAEGMYLALIEPGSYLDFANPVPFGTDSSIVELGLLNDEGRISGRAQSAVRPLAPSDFARMFRMGLDETDFLLHRVGDAPPGPGIGEQQQEPFEFEQIRERMSFITSRIVRDRVFRRIVLRAYDERCAISGLRLINGS